MLTDLSDPSAVPDEPPEPDLVSADPPILIAPIPTPSTQDTDPSIVVPKPTHKALLNILGSLSQAEKRGTSSVATEAGSPADMSALSDHSPWGDVHASVPVTPAASASTDKSPHAMAMPDTQATLAGPSTPTGKPHGHRATILSHHHPHQHHHEKKGGALEPFRRFFNAALNLKSDAQRHPHPKDKPHENGTHTPDDVSSVDGSRVSASGPPSPPDSRPASTAPSERSLPSLRDRCGKSIRMLGIGTGGTVRLFKLSGADGQVKTFAVKEFRKRGVKEDERTYIKRLTAEYCIASTLHHENVIETLDMVFEPPHTYSIMEYCPRDLYALLTTSATPPDLAVLFCYFAQLCRGINYLHESGIAHLYIKLENCVVSATGILKIIDFGAAEVIRSPWESNAHRVRGLRGSDPYVGPEVWKGGEYDGLWTEPTDA